MVSRLEARGLQKSYGSRKVVKDVSLAVFKGEVVGLLGPNGAGKTTSFYMLVGLLRSDAGQILLDNQPIESLPIHRRARLGLGYLPQEASIFRKLSVADNVRAVLELQEDGQGRSLDRATIDPSKEVKARYTGKSAGSKDDMVIAFQLALTWGMAFLDSGEYVRKFNAEPMSVLARLRPPFGEVYDVTSK